MSVPNVNLFLGYVDNLDKSVSKDLEARRFYSSNKEYDYVKYVNTGSKEKLDYVAYSGNNEKSKGIFNENGLLNAEQIKELRTNIRTTKSTIWHGVISFTEYFGNVNCDTYEKAYELMKSQLPKFFKNANLDPENIVWFAGLHENTDNKHIHFSFFEKEPLRYKQSSRFKQFSDGYIDIDAINQFKIDIEKYFISRNFNIFENRKEITNLLKKSFNDGAYMNKINKLIIVLPVKGRLSYDSENMAEHRPMIDNIVKSIIVSNPELKRKVSDFEHILSKRDTELLKAYAKIKVDCSDKLLYEKCMKDLYRRLGKIVILDARDIKTKQNKFNYETRNMLIIKHIEKKKRKILINKCMQLNDLVNKEIVNAFAEYRERLEEANYKRLREEGYLE